MGLAMVDSFMGMNGKDGHFITRDFLNGDGNREDGTRRYPQDFCCKFIEVDQVDWECMNCPSVEQGPERRRLKNKTFEKYERRWKKHGR